MGHSVLENCGNSWKTMSLFTVIYGNQQVLDIKQAKPCEKKCEFNDRFMNGNDSVTYLIFFTKSFFWIFILKFGKYKTFEKRVGFQFLQYYVIILFFLFFKNICAHLNLCNNYGTVWYLLQSVIEKKNLPTWWHAVRQQVRRLC